MKNITKICLSGLVALLFVSCGLGKMIPNSQVKMELENVQLENKGGKVEYTVKGTVPPKFMKKKAVIDIDVPVFKPEEATNMPTKANSIRLVGEKAKETGTVISYKNGGSFTVSGSFDYNDELATQEVVAQHSVFKGKKTYTYTLYPLGNGISNLSSMAKVTPTLGTEGTGSILMYAPHYYEKEFINQTGIIYFPVDVSSIMWGLKLNKEADAKEAIKNLQEFLVSILEDGRAVEKVVISGWASPEGEESRNQGLSEKRFEQGKKWFENQMNIAVRKYARQERISISKVERPTIIFENNAKGEDWTGFDIAVENSNIAEKNMILNVTRSQKTPEAREQRIREMTDIYTEIADVILPPLRRVEVEVVAPKNLFPDTDISDIVQSAPEQLSANERLFGASQIENLTIKEEIYTAMTKEVAMENDWRPYNNIAILKLNQYMDTKDAKWLIEAKNNLEKAAAISPNNGVVLNNMGILKFFQNNLEGARADFEKAKIASVEPTEQSYHATIFSILDGNYEEAKQDLVGHNCDYLTALVATLTKDYTTAKNAIDCVKNKTAETYYLAAVIAARTNVEQEVYSNLGKAIAADANYKTTAKNDAEFNNYRSKDAFKTLVR